MNHRHSSCAATLLTFALLMLSACSDSLPPVANGPMQALPEPAPVALPPVIHCAPGTSMGAVTTGHTQLATDCRAASTGAAS